MKVLLGGNSTVMVQIAEEPAMPAPNPATATLPAKEKFAAESPKFTPAEKVALKYMLVPFGN